MAPMIGQSRLKLLTATFEHFEDKKNETKTIHIIYSLILDKNVRNDSLY